MPRLFAGIEVPAETAQWLAAMRGGLFGARWIEPEDYHVTLRFIGDVDMRTASEIAEHARRSASPARVDRVRGPDLVRRRQAARDRRSHQAERRH